MYFAHLSFLYFRMEWSKNRIIHIADHKKYLGFSQQFPNGILNFGSLWQALYLRGPKWRCPTVLHHVAEATEWRGRFVRTMSNRPRCKMTFAICPQSRPQEWHLATQTHVRPGKKKNAPTADVNHVGSREEFLCKLDCRLPLSKASLGESELFVNSFKNFNLNLNILILQPNKNFLSQWLYASQVKSVNDFL